LCENFPWLFAQFLRSRRSPSHKISGSAQNNRELKRNAIRPRTGGLLMNLHIKDSARNMPSAGTREQQIPSEKDISPAEEVTRSNTLPDLDWETRSDGE